MSLIRTGWRRGLSWRHPARIVVLAFAGVITVGTALLMLPIATVDGQETDLITALFTATSAVCVTGLIVVDTPAHFTTFGEVVIMGLIQVGGFGIMTLASVLVLLVSNRLGLRFQLTTQAETKSLGLGDVRRVVAGVLRATIAIEAVVTVILALRIWIAYDEPIGRATYLGLFHAISAFNNAGFALYPDSLMRFATDGWICVPVMLAFIAGGLGFPVLIELWRRRQPRRWSLHTKVTLGTTAVLIVAGPVLITASEWTNPATLGPLGVSGKLLAGMFSGVTPRTAGFNTLDVAQLRPESLLGTDVLMFIGGGSAGTAGGIKVTTFALLAFVILAEVRGDSEVHVLRRRLPGAIQRQALSVALLGVGAVMLSTLALLYTTSHSLDAVLFEVISAFGTVGLSTGITADFTGVGHVVLVVLMFVGRLGPITLASALALRERHKRYELPEERPIVG